MCLQCNARLTYASKSRRGTAPSHPKAKGRAFQAPPEPGSPTSAFPESGYATTSTMASTRAQHPLVSSGSQEASLILEQAINSMSVQNSQLATTLGEINHSLQELARGQGQMIMMTAGMGNPHQAPVYPMNIPPGTQQTQGPMNLDADSDLWSNTEPGWDLQTVAASPESNETTSPQENPNEQSPDRE